jgi:hypothetical protein
MLDVNPDTRFDLGQIMAHPFIKDAADTFMLDIQAHPTPRVSASRSLVNVPAVVCPDGYSFAVARRAFSWPGPDSSDEPESL